MALPLEMTGSTVSRYAFKDINYIAMVNRRQYVLNKLPDMIFIDKLWNLSDIAPQNDRIHSKKVWVSGSKLHWYDQQMPICVWINLIWYHVDFMWHCISKRRDSQWAGSSSKVSIALGWSNGACMCINKYSDMIYIEIMLIFVAFPFKMTALAASRYEFQDIKRVGLINWWLNVWIK